MQSSHCQWKLNGYLFIQVSKYLKGVCLTHDISLHQRNTQGCVSQAGTRNPHRISERFSFDNFSICPHHHFAINGLAPLPSIYPKGNPQSLSPLWQRAYTTPLELISTTHYIEIWKVYKTLIGVNCCLQKSTHFPSCPLFLQTKFTNPLRWSEDKIVWGSLWLLSLKLVSLLLWESYKQITPLDNLQKQMLQFSCLVILSDFFAWLFFPTSNLKEIHLPARLLRRAHGFFSVAVA